jgi:hypothetical protein
LFASFRVAVSCWVEATPSARLADGGVTVTVATGTGLTVITGVDALGADPLVAVMTAVPTLAAVSVTVAPLGVLTELAALSERTAGLLDTQFTVRPARVLPDASFGVAVNCWDCPSMVGVVGADRATEATAASTVSGALPLFPPLVAVMFATPPASAVTTPVPDRVATEVLSEVQVTVRPVSTLLLASSSVALACDVCPAIMGVGVSETVTVATGTSETVTVEVPLWPSLVAVIVAVPIVVPAVTNPVSETAATAGLLDCQVTSRVRTTWCASSRTAVSCSLPP